MILLLAILLAARPAPAHQKPVKPDPARELAMRIQKFYARTKDFSARFAQHRISASLGRADDLTGTLRVKKPDLVRWDYETPEPRSIYLEGKTLSIYFPEDKQAQVNHDFGGDQLSSAFSFLWGKGDLLREFDPRPGKKPEGLPAGDALELLPKKQMPGVTKLLLVVGKDGQVQASLVTSPQGDTNQIVFSEPRVDQGLEDALFHFVPPKGTFVQKL